MSTCKALLKRAVHLCAFYGIPTCDAHVVRFVIVCSLLDLHPQHRNIVLVSPCSGHGYKVSFSAGEGTRGSMACFTTLCRCRANRAVVGLVGREAVLFGGRRDRQGLGAARRDRFRLVSLPSRFAPILLEVDVLMHNGFIYPVVEFLLRAQAVIQPWIIHMRNHKQNAGTSYRTFTPAPPLCTQVAWRRRPSPMCPCPSAGAQRQTPWRTCPSFEFH